MPASNSDAEAQKRPAAGLCLVIFLKKKAVVRQSQVHLPNKHSGEQYAKLVHSNCSVAPKVCALIPLAVLLLICGCSCPRHWHCSQETNGCWWPFVWPIKATRLQCCRTDSSANTEAEHAASHPSEACVQGTGSTHPLQTPPNTPAVRWICSLARNCSALLVPSAHHSQILLPLLIGGTAPIWTPCWT